MSNSVTRTHVNWKLGPRNVTLILLLQKIQENLVVACSPSDITKRALNMPWLLANMIKGKKAEILSRYNRFYLNMQCVPLQWALGMRLFEA